jgi:hypothetical protein
MIAAISPTQFSALKVLDPLDDEDERAEDDQRQGDVQQIQHDVCSSGVSLSRDKANPWSGQVRPVLTAAMQGWRRS